MLKFWVRVIHRYIDFYVVVKTRFRGEYYTQGRIIFEVLRYIYIYKLELSHIESPNGHVHQQASAMRILARVVPNWIYNTGYTCPSFIKVNLINLHLNKSLSIALQLTFTFRPRTSCD